MDFNFQISQWGACTRPSGPLPVDGRIHLLLDPAPTANPQSDESAFVVGYFSDYRECDSQRERVVLDMASNRWRGGALATQALNMIEAWKPVKFSYENIPGMDWFLDLLVLKAESRGLALPRIVPFSPNNKKGCKEKKIQNLQCLFDADPPLIVFEEGNYCRKLFDAARDFRVGNGKKGRCDDLLDVLSLFCFGTN